MGSAVAPSKIVILGSNGMLGQQVSREFLANSRYEVVRCARSGGDSQFSFTGQASEVIANELNLKSGDWLVNCVGWIPQKALGDSTDEKNAYDLNVKLPMELNKLSGSMDLKVIQVGTDCVFDGIQGGYTESSEMKGIDLYSRTKILGEQGQPLAMLIRSSIIGADFNSLSGLFSWFVSQSKEPFVSGFVDHRWNGVTTQALARVFRGIVESNEHRPGTWHLIPRDAVSKYELLKIFQELLGSDVRVDAVASKSGPRDRTLSTLNPDYSSRLWGMGGYPEVPSIREMVEEMISDYLEMSHHGKT
jgi:dTDP-4-dehydrorhamnose reductase